jgi:ribonuclease BN (tRNA processing enzyme)
MKVILFGNRGSIPLGASPGSPFEKYGGDTTCVGISFDDGTLVSFDAGSAFWKWPFTIEKLLGQKDPVQMHLFFSHFHLDHTMGLAQSSLLFNPANRINVYGPDFKPGLSAMFLQNANRPQNPDLTDFYKTALDFKVLGRNVQKNAITLDNGAIIEWIYNPHGPKEESVGYKITHQGQSLSFITDTHHTFDEHDRPVIDKELVDFIKKSDAMIYDCHFSDQELKEQPFMRDFGHSSGEHGVRLCQAADIPLLITSHHNPHKTDIELDKLTQKFRLYGAQRGVYVCPALPSLCLDLSQGPQAIKEDLARQKTAELRWNRIRGGPAV